MSQPIAPPPPPMPPATVAPASNRAMLSLIFGIIGVVCCQICGPVAWVMGKKELDAIKAGAAPAANQGLATAGGILGIIGTICLAFGLLWILFFGGMAVISALAHH